jgi:hypothetical protein
MLRARLSEVKKDPSLFRFVPSAGHVLVGPFVPTKDKPVVNGRHPLNLCYPPVGAKNNSWHLLKPPGGFAPISFQWLASAKQWFRLDAKAFRTGFHSEYLSSHGWTYLGRAKDIHG